MIDKILNCAKNKNKAMSILMNVLLLGITVFIIYIFVAACMPHKKKQNFSSYNDELDLFKSLSVEDQQKYLSSTKEQKQALYGAK